LEEVKKYSDREIAASEIIGRTIISKRFAEKILSIISKYHSRPNDLNANVEEEESTENNNGEGDE
jgi:hypothetical protein